MASHAPQENKDENGIISSHENLHISQENFENVSQLEIEVDALTRDNSELFELLQNERRKSKRLQNELKLGKLQENLRNRDAITAGDSNTSEAVLQDIVSMLKAKLESKESECEDLGDKLSVMNQELASQGEELARHTLEFENRIKHLHELLAQERELNSLLSEESDQTVRELQAKIKEKDFVNTELRAIQDETCVRMQNIEEECRFYQTKLSDTEKRLKRIEGEHAQLVATETDSVSCQVSESELHALEQRARDSNENEVFCEVFAALWENSDVEMSGRRNANEYTMNIFKLIRNGFKQLGEETAV